MTDTTDTKALPKMTLDELLIRCTDYDDGSLSMDASELKMLNQHISLLEAEHQRADRYHFVAMSALESQAEISEQLGISEDECDGSPEQIHEKIEMLQTELAALKGDQVPVAYLYMGDAMECKHVELAEDMDEGQAENCVPLFTAPQKPVVPVGFLFVVKATGQIIYSTAATKVDGAQLVGPIYGGLAIEAAGGVVKEAE